LQNRLGQQAAIQFMTSVGKGWVSWFDLSQIQVQRISQLMEKYADLPMDLADASLVILAEELGHGRIVSTDQRDFETYRWKNHYPFQNLLIP